MDGTRQACDHPRVRSWRRTFHRQLHDRGAWLIYALSSLLTHGCGSSNAAEVDPQAGRILPNVIAFESLQVTAVGSSAGPVSLQLGRDAELVTIRVSATTALDPRVAFTLEDVRVAGGDVWVEPPGTADFGEFCVRCRERISTGVGYGLFDLPSTAQSLVPIEELSFGIALRDATTWLPLPADVPSPPTLRVEWLGRAAPPDGEPLRLRWAVALASAAGFSQGADDPLLIDALSVVQSIWDPAGIHLERGAIVTLDAADVVRVAPDDRAALNDLSLRARAALPQPSAAAAALLVLTPCLLDEDPLDHAPSQAQGKTMHLPGGFGVGQEADGMFVAVESCHGSQRAPAYAANESAALGVIMAHELGHFLGLYHVRELGGAEDLLPDTSAQEPNLMQARPASEAVTLTPDQIRIARRHPALTRD